MACCIALALVISVVRATWFRLLPGRVPSRAGFAPPASRPAPGAHAPSPAPVPVEPPGPRAGRRPGPGPGLPPTVTAALSTSLLAGVAGAGLYAGAHQVLLALGVLADPAQGPTRDIVLLAAAALGMPVALAARTRIRANLAHALLGAGEAWTLLSALDMRHGPGMHGAMHGAMHHGGLMLGPARSSAELTAALAMHGPGLVALVAGLIGLAAGYARRISLRQPTLAPLGGSA